MVRRTLTTQRKKARRPSGCPIDYALDIFGDRWTLLVVRDLVFGGKCHFNEFSSSPERIASNILAARLKRLEQRGVITRRPDPGNRKQVVYELTEMGIDLVPVLIEIIRWGGGHDRATAAPKAFIDRIKTDRDELIAETVEAARRRVTAVSGKRG